MFRALYFSCRECLAVSLGGVAGDTEPISAPSDDDYEDILVNFLLFYDLESVVFIFSNKLLVYF